jgi:hypothetical protein
MESESRKLFRVPVIFLSDKLNIIEHGKNMARVFYSKLNRAGEFIIRYPQLLYII